MPGRPQNPNSRFRDQRLAIGLTVTALARQIGAPLQTVSRWDHGDNRPPWRWMLMLKLPDVFHLTSEEIVALLWGEAVGDSCPRPHDCNGKKILPDDPLVPQTLNPGLRRYIPGSLRLLIAVPCAGCEREHAYTQSQPHPRFCPNCCDRGPKAETKPYKCVGYPRYGKTPAYGPSCPGQVDLLPGEVRKRQKQYNKEKSRKSWSKYRHLEDGKIKWAKTSGRYRVNWARSFIDESSGMYRCGSCAFASLRFEVHKARLEEIEGDKPRSEREHSRLWKDNFRDLIPNFDSQAGVAARKKLLRTKDGKERLYGERYRVGISNGKNIAAWYAPPKCVLALCRVCDELTYNSESHISCYRAKRKGVATFLPRKRGQVADNENLKRAFCWAVRYLRCDESFVGIAEDARYDRKFVEREIKRILLHVPVPDKVPRKFKKIVSLVREAAIRKGLPLTNDKPAVAASGISPIESFQSRLPIGSDG